MHDHIEMLGMLDAALQATEKFTVLELGAGWGPWVVMGAAMARKRGLEYRLIAIEGSSDHFDFMKTHFLDNGLNPADHKIFRGVVAAGDGIAKFPKITNPSSDYGASIGVGAVLEDVEAYSVATLLRGEPVIDILHCDVQGNEVDVLAPALVELRKQVRRIVIGTHGRKIEESLFDLFGSAGWRLEGDAACQMKQADGSIVLVQDGAQLWVNPDDV
jgi:FkbM family methyltransferase